MIKVCITYHMERNNEIAESCIVLPMTDIQAKQLLEGQYKYSYGIGKSHSVQQIIDNLASLQGYKRASFVCADKDE